MLLLICTAVLPAVLILAALNWGRPWKRVFACLGLGALSALPAAQLEELLLGGSWSLDTLAVLAACAGLVGLIEESCKLALFSLFPRPTQERPVRIILMVAVGLGFATVENIMYVLDGGLGTALARAVTAVPAHAICGVILGSGSWAGAVVFHGVYDTFALLDAPVGLPLLVLWLLLGLGWSLRLLTVVPGLPFLSATPRRNRWLTGLVGFVPGLGQLVNLEGSKAMLFASLAGLSYLGYRLGAELTWNAFATVRWLERQGFHLNVKTAQAEVFLQSCWVLVPLGLGLLLLTCLLAAADAYLTAARRPSGKPTAVAGSLLSHAALVALFVLVPLSATRKQQAPLYDLTWVLAPQQLEGWNPGSEGTSDRSGGEREDERLKVDGIPEGEARESSRPSRVSAGVADRRATLPARQQSPVRRGFDDGEGVSKSYSAYLSARMAEVGRPWFRQLPSRSDWAVLEYTIDSRGRLVSVRVPLCSRPAARPEDLVRRVKESGSFAPLPEGIRRIHVYELCWSSLGSGFRPGTLPDRLSKRFDGRWIQPQ